MKNAFDGLTRKNTTEERISELENITTEIFKTGKQREQKLKER